MHIFVGSYAAYKQNISPSYQDIDIWTDNCSNVGIVDEVAIPLHILNKLKEHSVLIDGELYASLDALYTIKASHMGWDILWEKHKKYLLTLKHKGAKLLPDLYTILKEYWKQEHGNKDYLSLYKRKTEFFDDYVEYIYDHDYLHELVAFPNKPMYTKCLKDGYDVAIDKDKFFLLSLEERVRMFREEIIVIACERWILNPHLKNKVSWTQAWGWSLRKTVTSLTKNWATDFIIEHLDLFVKPRYNDFKNILETLGGAEMNMTDFDIFKKYAEQYGVSLDTLIYVFCENQGRFLGGEGFPESYKHIEQEGGGEGGSEYCYGVFELEGKIYKAEYSYYSYEGHYYGGICDTVKEVFPVEKTTIVYE